MNSRHKNIKFTKEIEKDNSLAFLYILIDRKDNKFETSNYRNPTFSGVYPNFNNYVPGEYKKALLSVSYFASTICAVTGLSSMRKFTNSKIYCLRINIH